MFYGKIALRIVYSIQTQRACWGHESRHAETVRFMFDMGVPFDLASRDGKTCVQLTKNRETLLAIQDAAKAMVAAKTENEL